MQQNKKKKLWPYLEQNFPWSVLFPTLTRVDSVKRSEKKRQKFKSEIHGFKEISFAKIKCFL